MAEPFNLFEASFPKGSSTDRFSLVCPATGKMTTYSLPISYADTPEGMANDYEGETGKAVAITPARGCILKKGDKLIRDAKESSSKGYFVGNAVATYLRSIAARS